MAQDWTPLLFVESAVVRVQVYVTEDRGTVGTGFVVHPGGYIMTAAHLLSTGPTKRITVNGWPAAKVKMDTRRDMLLLKVDRDFSRVLFQAPVVRKLESIAIVGYPMETDQPKWAFGRVSDVSDPYMTRSPQLWTDTRFMSGMSGAPAINLLGEVVGMVVNSPMNRHLRNFTAAVTVKDLDDFLGDRWDTLH